MRIAVLPFNAAKDSRPALARQFAQFASEIARSVSDGDIDAVNYMAQFQEDGVVRAALVNPSEELNEPEMLQQFLAQAKPDKLVDGLYAENPNGGGKLTYRVFEDPSGEPSKTEELNFLPGGEFGVLRSFINELVSVAGGKLPDEMLDDENLFGTTDPGAFTKFLEGYDTAQYIERSSGNVTKEFSPDPAFDALFNAIEKDPDWEAPMLVALQIVRLCTNFRVGNANNLETVLNKLAEKHGEDGRVWYALGDLKATVGDNAAAADAFEKALRFEPNEPAIMTRLAVTQLNLGMPVNAERNLRQAIELEGDEKPSLDILSNVLVQTGRAHEVPAMWKDVVDKNPQNGLAQSKYAMALLQSGRKDEAVKAFDHALETVEDNLVVKRFYAPLLAQEDDLDRAMDFYEDVLDENPNDVPLMIEYAQTLQKAKRDFEVPPVLKNILQSNPDVNTKANVQAWLIELEQPKRVEAVQAASEKAEKGDFDGAIRELKPLRNWLADYWKMWAVLAAAHNHLKQYGPAEEAARRLLEIFPACEPGYVELNNALAGQGKTDEAFNLMQVALHNMSNSLPIAVSYALAAKRAGNPDEAKRLAKQIREATNNAEELQDVLAEIERD
ncbi:MAG: tetratricopeptide repeat protein [Fimbriimonadaceae bacterium]|nr:tetratricopeptide repeat protein [Fimbriimonadaceae bacterium]